MGQKFACGPRAGHVCKTPDSCQLVAAHFPVCPGDPGCWTGHLTAVYEFASDAEMAALWKRFGL
jgi:hypothetical protein